MSQTNVQSINNSATATTLSLTLGSNVTVGNLIVILFTFDGTQVSPEVTGITDGLGNTYHDSGVYLNDAADATSGTIWYGLVTTGGACVLSVTFTHNMSHRGIAHEFSNTNGWDSSPFDAGVGAGGAAGVVPASGSFTTTGSDDLIVATELDRGGTTHAAGSGWTLGNTTGGRYRTEYQLDVAAGSYNGNWATNAGGAWVSIAAGFKTASGGGGTVSHLLSTMGCGA